MKKLKIIGIFLLIILLSSCTKTFKEDEIDCNINPENEGCIVDPVDCNLHPDDEKCIVEEIDCDADPTNEGCKLEEVDCNINPENEACVVEDEKVESCEVQAIEGCLFTLSEAFSDGSFETINTYKTLNDADTILEESSNPNLVVLQNNKVVNMKYGVINFKTKRATENTNIAQVDFNKPTYLNGNYNIDGLFLDADSIFTRGMIAGVEFELLTSEVELIPNIQSRNAYSYFTISNSELFHVVSADLKSQSYWTIGPLDQAPAYLVNGAHYYNYDNHYFYTDIITMTDDINNKTREHSVNSSHPYYNYYQYLSFRSKTNYSAEELNTYINANVSAYSVLRDSGSEFIDAQNNVFINAALELSFAIHESGWGSSRIAVDKNNLFGINAYDSNPYESALTFDSLQDCVEYHLSSFLQTRYFNPAYFTAFGTNLGDKHQGMNYKYASDAYWGEKIAAHYYNLDKALGFKDYNAYKIVLLDIDALGYYGPTTDGIVVYDSKLYNYYGLQIPFVVTRETDQFYVLQLPLALNNEYTMDISEIMTMTDVFYVLKEDATLIN